jgi:hypothetical protein
VDLKEAAVVKMILGNIPFIKRKDTTTPVDFRKLKYLGSGVEADVYGATKAGKVVKILRFPQGFDYNGVQNNPFLHYVSMCLHNVSNPYFPKFMSAKVYEIPFKSDKQSDNNTMRDEMDRDMTVDHPDRPSDFMLIVIMEHLLELDEIDLDDGERVFNEHGMTLDATDAEIDTNKRGDKGYISLRSLGMDNKNLKRVLNNTNNPEFHDALKKLAPLFKRFGGDTHSGNLMFRSVGDGYQLVFTDPLYPEELH